MRSIISLSVKARGSNHQSLFLNLPKFLFAYIELVIPKIHKMFCLSEQTAAEADYDHSNPFSVFLFVFMGLHIYI